MFYHLFKKIAFSLDAENAHELTIRTLSRFPAFALSASPKFSLDKRYHVKVGSHVWPFPVGLAAGLDKNAQAIDYFARIPFGAIEVGTVTPKAQEGNPRPRLFRYPEDESLRNCMGFNNIGADRVYHNIEMSNRWGKILGVNLGKNKNTPEEEAKDDYLFLYEKFAPIADYLVINISSPNTPGLRDLQKVDALKNILNTLEAVREKSHCPLYVKISPDLSYEDLPGIVQLAQEFRLEGLIATNTTRMPERGEGGVSGKLLQEKAQNLRDRLLKLMSGSNLELIGVGGVNCIDQLVHFWKHGGKVVQVYTSFIYQGPAILSHFKQGIDQLLEKNNVSNLEELIALKEGIVS